MAKQNFQQLLLQSDRMILQKSFDADMVLKKIVIISVKNT